MSHTTADEEAAGRAALYALGALEGDEARDFEEHVAAGCEACAVELREFEGVVAGLGLAAAEAEPPEGVRSRLLALVSEGGGGAAGGAAEDCAAEDCAEAAPADAAADGPNLHGGGEGFLVVRAGEGAWLPTGDAGVSYKMLYADPGRGTFTTLVRMRPGSRIRPHRHLGVEQCLVLEGDVRSGATGMTAGDFNCSLPGSVHEELVTINGALLLLVSPERYEPIGPHGHARA
ncbi:MAG TPA: cupin domain-containing protein [Pyrinomonadaceae bacterium]|jgi:quercetin dioxygenase-like cupin family protein